MSNSKKKSNFIVQGSILAVASIISRIIGLLYRLPMTDIIGDLGNSYYSTAFELYSVMLMISSYSLPLAVSKLVSSSMAKGQRKMTYKILKGALIFATVSGTLVAFIVYFGAEFFTNTLLKTPISIFALKILAPALVVVAILGVIRGFFQGLGTMMPSAISQILEQIVNAVVSVWAAFMLVRMGAKVGAVLGDKENYAAAYGAAGGTLGTNLGSVFALLFVLFVLVVYLKVLSAPIFTILFPSTVQTLAYANKMMWMGSIAVVFYSMSTLSNGLLQGINRMKAPVKNAIIALVAHILLLIAMMMFFRLNIYAVVIANTLFALFMCILNARDLYRYSGYKQEVVKTFIIPAICSLIMGVVAFGVYQGIYKLTSVMPLAFVVAFALAVVVYAVTMLLLKGLEEDEILKFPKGASLVRLFKKINLLK